MIWPTSRGCACATRCWDWFKETPHSVLLAARFWEGVDIPGEDLSLISMPFPDPLQRMRSGSFSDYMIPLMTLSLKQGFVP